MSLKFILIVALCGIQVNAASDIFNSSKLITGYHVYKTQVNVTTVHFNTKIQHRKIQHRIKNEFEGEMNEIIDTAIENENNDRSIINDIMNSTICKWSDGNKNSDEINKLMNISSHLNYILMHMDHKFAIIKKEMQKSSMQSEIDLVRQGIADDITNIRRHYMMTSRYSNEVESHDCDELESVMKTLTDQRSGKDVQSSLASLFDRTVGRGIGNLTSNFLKLYGEYWEMRGEELCGTGLSPNTYLYNLYTIIISAEMMGLVSVSFRYELQYKLHKNSTINNILEAAQRKREERLKKYLTNFKSAIESSPLDYRSCDPPEHNRGETFFEMEGLYQTIMTHEHGKNYPGSCVGDCDTINMTNYQEQRKICGRISQCSAIEDPTWCQTTGQFKKYHWIKSAGHTYGVGSICSGSEDHAAVWFLNSAQCDICRCICEGNSLKLVEDYPNSTHVISLLPVTSDISSNMTITGVRLKVRDGIVHIQIKEGQLQALGQVTSNSTWKDVPDMRTEVYLARNGSSNIYQEGRDFVVIDTFHNAINLDDVMAPSGYLVTGIKWGFAQKSETNVGWQRLEIQIRYTPFNFTSGVLGNSSESQWTSSPMIHDQQLQLGEGDSPEKSIVQNIPTAAPKTYVNFISSNFSKDAGQSTVPFLDGVPVESGLGPLTGIGLFHKAAEGYAGFLSFRLYSLNMAKYITSDPNLLKNQDDYYVPLCEFRCGI